MKDKLVIIGASGHGKVVADIAFKIKKWDKIMFLDDNKELSTCLGSKPTGILEDKHKYKGEADFFVAIGDNNIRAKVLEELIEEEYDVVTLIHPRSIIGTDVSINIGTVIMAGAIVNSSTKVGKGVIINTGSTIDHDNVIGNYVHISPGVNLAGGVKVGEKAWIGIGSNVIQEINICKNAIIGAGTTVIKNIEEEGTYVGVPARKVK